MPQGRGGTEDDNEEVRLASFDPDTDLSLWRELSFSLCGVGPQVSDLPEAVRTLPAWPDRLVGDEERVANYELPAHANTCTDDETLEASSV